LKKLNINFDIKINIKYYIFNMDNCILTITPISKKVSSPSNRDYKEQLERVSTGELKWCWDDSNKNKAKKNQYFAFYFYGKKVVLHRIEAVKSTAERLETWHANIGQNDRQVLELSEPIKEFSWEQWNSVKLKPNHVIRDTYTVKTMTPELLNLLESFEK
jgi:hypothetical protein